MKEPMIKCRPVRFQLHAEVEANDAAKHAGTILWLLERTAAATKVISAKDLRDSAETSLEWHCYGRDAGMWHTPYPGRGKRSSTLARFERGLLRGSHPHGAMSWDSRINVDEISGLRTSVSFRWFDDVLHLDVECCFSTGTPDVIVPLIERSMIALCADAVGEIDPLFLNLTDDKEPGKITALESAQNRRPFELGLRAGDLASYSWVTWLSDDQVVRLGGVERLLATGAFHAIHPTATGCLAQATEHLEDYVGERVRAVRDALDLVVPKFPTVMKWPGLRLAWDDGTSGPFVRPDGSEVSYGARRF